MNENQCDSKQKFLQVYIGTVFMAGFNAGKDNRKLVKCQTKDIAALARKEWNKWMNQ